jgi:TetR/AcrR family transcriptional regulator, copper-responsive repressor
MVDESSEAPKQGRPKTFARDRAIDVAMETYWREGTDDVPLNEVCRRANVSKPGVYREFGGEDGLMDAALERYAKTVLPQIYDQIADDRPFAEVLEALLAAMTQPDDSVPAGCLLAKMRMVSSHLGPATQARAEALSSDARARYAVWVERAKARGEIASGVPTDVAAAFIDTQFTVLLVQMAAGAEPGQLRAQARLAFVGLIAGGDRASPPN